MNNAAEQLEEPRLNPNRTLPFPAKLTPQRDELFRSFLARTARANKIPYYLFLNELGIDAKSKTPQWVGVNLTAEEAELIAPILRQDAQALLDMQLQFELSGRWQQAYHPTRYRACAECQVEHGAWMRWNADPLYILCPIHKTLLWNEGPSQQRLNHDSVFAQSNQGEWRRLCARTSADLEKLAEVQTDAGRLRFFDLHIEVRFTELLVAYRRAVNAQPDNPQLIAFSEPGWKILDAHNRDRTDQEQQDRVTTGESIWTRVEDAIAIYPTAAPLLIDAQQTGDTDTYDDTFATLFELGDGKTIQTNSAARFTGGVFVEAQLNSDAARKWREEVALARKQWEEELLANPRGRPRSDPPLSDAA